MGRIRYQKKDLEKLELRGWVPTLTSARIPINERKYFFSAYIFAFKLFDILPKGVEPIIQRHSESREFSQIFKY